MTLLLQDMVTHFAGQEVSLAVLEVTRASRKVVCSVVKAKENDDLRHLEVRNLPVANELWHWLLIVLGLWFRLPGCVALPH